MGIHFDNPADKFGLRPFSGTVPGNDRQSKSKEPESDSFIRLLKQAAGITEEESPASRPDQADASIKARQALELCHRMKLQMNESLLKIVYDNDREDNAGNSFMASLKAILPGQDKEEALLSRIRQASSEIGQQKAQPADRSGEKKAIPQTDNTKGPDIEGIIQNASSAYGVDPDLIRGVIEAESSFKPDAVSSKGAMGLMQLMPGTARELGVTDPLDPTENVMAGTRYLKKLLNRYHGSVPHALAAYNWGMGNLDSGKNRMPLETRNYVAKITGVYFS